MHTPQSNHQIAPHSTRRLDALQVGDRGTIVALDRGANAELRNKLLVMGIVPGAPVELMHIAPLGDPMSFKLLDFQLSLRMSEASHVTVEMAPEMVP